MLVFPYKKISRCWLRGRDLAAGSLIHTEVCSRFQLSTSGSYWLAPLKSPWQFFSEYNPVCHHWTCLYFQMYTFFFILASLRAATPWSSSANHMLTVQLLGRLNHHFWNNCLHHHIYHDHTHHLFDIIICNVAPIISPSGSSWTLPSWSRRYVWEGGTKMPQEAKYVRLREANLYYGVASSRLQKWSSQRVVALLLNPVNIEQLPKQVQVLVQIIELNWIDEIEWVKIQCQDYLRLTTYLTSQDPWLHTRLRWTIDNIICAWYEFRRFRKFWCWRLDPPFPRNALVSSAWASSALFVSSADIGENNIT